MYYVLEFKNRRIGFHKDARIPFRHVLAYQYAYHWGARSWKKALSVAGPRLVRRLFRCVDLRTHVGDGVDHVESVLSEVFALDSRMSYNVFLLFPPQKDRHRLFAFSFDDSDVCKSFVKVGWSIEDSSRILAEVDAIERWNGERTSAGAFRVPKIVEVRKVTDCVAYARYVPIPSSFTPAAPHWNDLCQRVWDALRQFGQRDLSIEDAMGRFETSGRDEFWKQVIESVTDRNRESVITFCASHGDFAPWNMRVGSDGLYLIDWENFAQERPLLYDPIHFFVRVEQLLRRRSARRIAADLPKFLARVDSGGNRMANTMLSLGSLSRTSSGQHPNIFREIAEAYWKRSEGRY